MRNILLLTFIFLTVGYGKSTTDHRKFQDSQTQPELPRV